MTLKKKFAIGISAFVVLATLFIFLRPATAMDLRITLSADNAVKHFAGEHVAITAKVQQLNFFPYGLDVELQQVEGDYPNGNYAWRAAGTRVSKDKLIDVSSKLRLIPGKNILQLFVFPRGGNSPFAQSQLLTIYAYSAELPTACPLDAFNKLAGDTKLIAATGADLFDAKPKGTFIDCTMAFPNSDVFVPVVYASVSDDAWAKYLADTKGKATKLGIGETAAFTYTKQYGELFGDVKVTVFRVHNVMVETWLQDSSVLQIASEAIKVK
jgi:hypothetical protein